MACAEDILEQIDKSNICRNELYSKSEIKNALRRLAFNLINFEDARIFKDPKKIKIIQQLRQNVVILKPDKGNSVVLLDNQDYVDSVEQLFKDQAKFVNQSFFVYEFTCPGCGANYMEKPKERCVKHAWSD